MWRPDLGESVGLREKKNKVLKEAVKKGKKLLGRGSIIYTQKLVRL